jgi:hypothetical protein
MNQFTKIAYAVVGAGDLAAEKARGMMERAWALPKEGPKDAEAMYEDLAKRGEHTYKKVSRSKQAERAKTHSKVAARQFKGAITSLRKAVGAEPEQPRRTRAKAS